MEEKCENCRFCYTLYIPPTINSEQKYEYCCTLFLDEGSIMYLDNDVNNMCECFLQRKIQIKKKQNIKQEF